MPKILGICGPSGSGKTTLANLLAKEIHADVVGLDNYFLLDTPYKKYNDQGKDLELPENTDWIAINNLVTDIKSGKESTVRKVCWEENNYTKQVFTPKNVVIIEGFLLLHNIELVNSLDLTVYIDISDEIGLSRRIAREGSDFTEWFKEVTFPEYKQHREVFKKRADLILDGELALEENVKILRKALDIK